MAIRGTRTVVKICACGCDNQVQPYIHPTTNRVQYYPKFIPGHGAKDWGKRWSKWIKENGHPQSKPIGSRQRAHSGYIRIKCSDGKWHYEHRIVANAPPDKHVHHINGDTSDNSPKNLTIISSSDHPRVHLTITSWSKLHAFCLECGTTQRKHCAHGLCTRCWQQKRFQQRGHW